VVPLPHIATKLRNFHAASHLVAQSNGNTAPQSGAPVLSETEFYLPVNRRPAWPAAPAGPQHWLPDGGTAGSVLART
jgi:hypothetical protein